MSTAASCYENGTAVERMWHAACSAYHHLVLIHSTLEETPQNSLICELGRAWLIFFEYRAHFSFAFLYKREPAARRRGIACLFPNSLEAYLLRRA